MLAGYATHTDAARGLPRRPEWNLAMTPRRCCNKKDTARCCRHLDDDDLCRRPRRAPAPAPSLAIMGRALALVCAAVTCAVAAGAGANEPIAPNELGLTAIDCATQYCTSKDSLLLWLALENTCFSDKQPRAAASSNVAGPRGCSRRRAGGGGSAAAAAENVAGPRGAGAPRRAARGGSVHASSRRARSSHRFPDAVAFLGTRRRRRSRPWTSRRPCPSSGPSTSSAPSPCRSWPSASSSATPRARAPRSSTGDRRRGARFCSLNTSSFIVLWNHSPPEGHVSRRS